MKAQKFELFAAAIRVPAGPEAADIEIRGPYRLNREEIVVDLHMMARVAKALGHTAQTAVRTYRMTYRPL